jgi:broad specificity phosphatase PhoE
MTRLVLVRHGQVEGIKPSRFRGRRDVPLNGLGVREAALTAARVARGWRVARIVGSPMLRCRQTAAEIATATGVGVEVDERLTDMDYGAWTWKTDEEARASDPAAYQLWVSRPDEIRPGGGESLQELAARSAEAIDAVVAPHSTDEVVIVTHDSVVRVVVLGLLGLSLSAYRRLDPSPCGISEAEAGEAPPRLLRFNETGHLDPTR